MNRKRPGIATLVLVLVVATLLMVIMLSWQYSLLLTVQRSVALSDLLKTTYTAESRVFDIVSRFLGDFPLPPFGGPTELSDGTKLTLSGNLESNPQLMKVLASRQFSTTTIELSRTKTENTSAVATPVDIILSLDCSGSMGEKACDNPSNPECQATRMEKLKEALIGFLENMNEKPGAADNVRIGLSVFGSSAKWVQDGSGVDIKPESNLSFLQIRSVVQNRFANGGSVGDAAAGVVASPACSGAGVYTNIGSGLVLAHNHFSTLKLANPSRKQVEILVTDGYPTARSVDIRCPVSRQCELCESDGRNYMKCALANTLQSWQQEAMRSVDSRVAGVSTDRLLAFIGEPTLTPTTTPTRTPTPTKSPTPTQSVGGPTRTPTPTLPPLCGALTVYPDTWPKASRFYYENRTSNTISVDWRMTCSTPNGCDGIDRNVSNESLGAFERRSAGFGAICKEWYFSARVANSSCPWIGWTAVAVNCPTPTLTPTPTLALGATHNGIRDPGIDLYTVSVLSSDPLGVNNIFRTYAKKHFDPVDATGLDDAFEDIFGEIIEKIQKFDIKKIVPQNN